MYEHVKAQDPEIYSVIMNELGRQRSKIELIASENFVWHILNIKEKTILI